MVTASKTAARTWLSAIYQPAHKNHTTFRKAQATCAQVAFAGITLAVDDHPPEGPEDETGNAPGRKGPRQANNGASQDEAPEQPQAARHKATEDEPQDIEQKSHEASL